MEYAVQVDLAVDVESDDAQFLTIQYNAHHASLNSKEEGQCTLTLHLTADTVEQAAMLGLTLLMPNNHPVLRFDVCPSLE